MIWKDSIRQVDLKICFKLSVVEIGENNKNMERVYTEIAFQEFLRFYIA